MVVLLLIIIYLSFISLGLPDSLFGSSWLIIHLEMNVPLSFAGFVTITISIGTIISSLLSERLTTKFGSGKVTCISVLLTALALIGFSFANQFWMLILLSIPLGLGAGAIDAALNNYVSLHFSSKHMSWLHCFWGIGASISPYIISYWLSQNNRWDMGYLTIGIILSVITIILFISLPLWKKVQHKNIKCEEEEEEKKQEPIKLLDAIKLKGLKSVLFAFLAYCSIETIFFSWTSSYLNIGRLFSIEDAAKYASLFYLGMTISRLILGFFSEKIGDKNMIRIGYLITFIGIGLIFIPIDKSIITIIGLFITGFGCGPIYPSIIHSTPNKFGKKYSQVVIGLQMAFAYLGSSFAPPLFGIFANYVDIKLLPFFTLFFAIIGFILIENSNKIISKQNH